MNEEFEKWWDEHDKYDWQRDEQYETAKKFFLAGAAAMRERCAEMTDKFTVGRYRENEYEFDLMTERIATAIRKIEVE